MPNHITAPLSASVTLNKNFIGIFSAKSAHFGPEHRAPLCCSPCKLCLDDPLTVRSSYDRTKTIKSAIKLSRSLQTNATIPSDDSPLCKKRFLSYTSHTITWRSKCEISPWRCAEVAVEPVIGRSYEVSSSPWSTTVFLPWARLAFVELFGQGSC